MGKRKTVQEVSGLGKFEFESVLLDTPIVCANGHEITRGECKSEPASFAGVSCHKCE